MLVTDVELNCKLDNSCKVIAAVFNQNLYCLVCLSCLEVQVGLLHVQPCVSTHFSRFKGWIFVCRLQKRHQILLVEFYIKLDLTFVVLARHLFVDQKNLMKEQVHVFLLVFTLFICQLTATLAQFLHAGVHDFKGFVPSMSLKNILHSQSCIYAQQFTEVWAQWKINLPLVQESKDALILLSEDRIECVLKKIYLLVKLKERL